MSSSQAGEITSSSVDHVGIVSQEEPILTARGALKDILFGSFAGMVAEIFEYPFDLAKVRLQAQLLTSSSSNIKRFDGPMDCLIQTWREEGLRGLYRGLPAPMIGSMAETASVFVAYSAFQNAIRTFYFPPSSYSSSPPALSIPQLSVAASGAGFITSFVLTPIELVKCKMQVQMMNFNPSQPAAPGRIPRRPLPIFSPSSTYPFNSKRAQPSNSPTQTSNSARMPIHDLTRKSSSITSLTGAAETLRPPGPIALIRSIVDTYGVRGLWLGHTGTLLRETGGTASWFVAKEWVALVYLYHGR